MRVRANWQQNVEEKMKKRSITIIPLMVKKSRGETLWRDFAFYPTVVQVLPKTPANVCYL